MSFERDPLVFHCDGCPATFASNLKFAAAWADAETTGWTTRKPAGRPWEHYCSACGYVAMERSQADQERELLKERNQR